MNRALTLGLAMFVAVVGIALLSGEKNTVLAGHGCHGCDGASGCDGAAECCGRRARRCCGEPSDCCGRQRRHRRCCGETTCCPPSCCGTEGGSMEGEKAPKSAPPAPSASLNRGFKAVSFVR